MAGQMLLINPSRRKRRRKNAMHHGGKRRRRTMHRAANPVRRRRRRNVFVPGWARAMNPHRRRARRRNPARHFAFRRRRHRNPIGMGGIVALLKDAAMQSVGSVAIDYAFGYVKGMLPASLQNAPGQTIGVGDAVKALFTAVAGSALSKPTRGFSRSAALGSLTVQFRYLLNANLPTSITAQLGWYQPAPVVQGTRWTSASRGTLVRNTPLLSGRSGGGVGAFVRSGLPTLSSAPGMPVLMPNVVSAPSAIPIR